ncbi:MAG TPA: aspartate ammonia-lyase [Geomonas sp.]|nr:aspartate ammonia-lyase [Geomonas sp.]HJV35248.1 aspartate ammonia-lyase [Geomonas sp.]
MSVLDHLITQAANATGIPAADLKMIAAEGERKTFAAGEYLFHESTPRLWCGFVEEGEIEIVRGLHGSPVHLSTLAQGAMISEGALLDETPHATSAFTRTGATILQIPRKVWTDLQKSRPDVFYRIVARCAQRQSERLNLAAQIMAGQAGPEALVTAVRREHDLLGDRDVPLAAYYGVQSLRGLENFPISGMPLSNFAHFVDALAMVKKAAAQANAELGVLAKNKMEAICQACDEILAGKLHSHFVVDMIQGGAGTSTNMNANEVIANRALELMGHEKGEYKYLHPNDDVNCSQSTNDAYPTAIKLAVYQSLQDTLGALGELQTSLKAKEQEFSQILKMGRTENQDAVPMTLGQEFGAYAVMIGSAMKSMRAAAEELTEINMGATAIGTGINSPPGYAELVTRKLSAVSGLNLTKAENLVEATQDSGVFSQMSGNMKRAAVQLSKICNDLRWMSSGPRCGLYEIRLPAMQPGSSIMPGKVNPVIPEMVSQVCFTIIGYDVTVTMASEASELELNMAEPIIAYCLLHGLMILKNAAITLASRCIDGIQPNVERCREYVQNSIGLVTALNPVLGYEKSVAIAKEALETNGSVYDLVLQKGWLTKAALDDILQPENMTKPRKL